MNNLIHEIRVQAFFWLLTRNASHVDRISELYSQLEISKIYSYAPIIYAITDPNPGNMATLLRPLSPRVRKILQSFPNLGADQRENIANISIALTNIEYREHLPRRIRKRIKTIRHQIKIFSGVEISTRIAKGDKGNLNRIGDQIIHSFLLLKSSLY